MKKNYQAPQNTVVTLLPSTSILETVGVGSSVNGTEYHPIPTE